MLRTIPIYAAAALAEIAGCFAFWAWFRLDKSALWLVPGMISLAAFGWLLALVPVEHAGRAYQPVDEVVVPSGRWSKPILKRSRAGTALFSTPKVRAIDPSGRAGLSTWQRPVQAQLRKSLKCY